MNLFRLNEITDRVRSCSCTDYAAFFNVDFVLAA